MKTKLLTHKYGLGSIFLIAVFCTAFFSTAHAAIFNRSLTIGSKGSDVSALQQFLKTEGLYKYPSVTGYFGSVTKNAVIAFQKKNNIDPIGVVGPATRAKITSLMDVSIAVSVSTPTTTGPGPVITTPVITVQTAQTTAVSTSSLTSSTKIYYGGGSYTSGPPDVTPPVISAIVSSPTTTAATITWTTDENSSTQIDYGLTNSYGITTNLNLTLTTAHSVSISGLTANTAYHFRVHSTDPSGNTATSVDQTFTTPSTWVLAGASADLDFAGSQYYGDTLTNTVSVSRNTPTAYASDKAGDLIAFGANTPRITNQGLLVESASTNIMTHSDFASGWGTSATSLTSNYAVSPDSTTDAAFLKEDSSTGSHNMGPNGAITKPATASAYTLSFYASRASVGSARDLAVNIWDGSFANGTNLYFNINTGITQYGTPSGFINVNKGCVPASHNYWRCSYTFITPATANLNLSIGLTDNDGTQGPVAFTASYQGDNTSGVYLYGVQIEQGLFPSSYIPTTSSTVTRPADIVTLTGAVQTLLNASAGTAAVFTTAGTSFSTAANILDSNGTALLGFTSSDTLIDSVTSPLTTSNTANRIVATDRSAIAWDGTGRSLILNGGSATTDAVLQTPSATLHLGSNGSSNFLNGYVSRLTLWNTKQSNPQSNFSLVAGSTNFGVNVSGPENPSPVWPLVSDWSYLASKGVHFVRLTLAWENIQPTLASPLNTTYLNALKSALASASANGIQVLLNPVSFAHYVNQTAWGSTIFSSGNGGSSAANVYTLGDSNLPISDLTDLWTRMATALVGTPGLGGYDLANEPVNLPNSTIWPTAAQDSINAIRAIDSTTPIYVPGDNDGYDAASWEPTLVTGTHLVYEAHQYFDFDPSTTDGSPGTYNGTYTSYNTNNYEGIRSLLAWLGWLKVNNLTGSLDEFGVPNDTTDNDAQWLVLQQHVEALLAQQGVQALMHFYGGNGAGTGSTLQFNPVGGVDDARLTQAMGQF